MAVLITGGAGYIGSHTCIELLNVGYEIIVVDNFSNSKPEALKRVSELTRKYFKTYCLDLQNREGLEKIFTDNKIEAVIHLAGLKAVGESVHFPLKYYENNINSTVTLCEVMKKFEVKNLVFSSSATVYGATETVPISENTPLGATNPYGRTKQMIEGILEDLYESDHNWSIALLRYFNPVGAHVSGRIGEDPSGVPNNLMPYISQVAVGKLETLKVFGDNYSTVDGTGVRDYIHVVDLAKGHVKALEKMLISKGVESYNLGTGQGYSVLEVIAAFEKASGKTISYSIVERRPGDVGICYADASKAKKELGWVTCKGLDEMCQDSWRWQQNNPHGYNVETKLLIRS
ncbi:UDP-glucose 4-epimerase GalE [Rossellomorea aquimaris]|uniref:UDP-glucose 4-epimerase GalE n=1 Tax=Rossellomorea aquimaris TaxID=189382 RepID=UPI0007D055F5|nr:UDP-glucose 4-epimerase GalE [Rossellomorea aquimaris]